MKATELQLGNLVLLGDKIIRVDAIHKRKVGYHVRFDKLKFVFEYIVNPIPLTPEILEKNGFVNVFRGRYRFDDNKGSIVEVSTINGVIKWVRVSKYDSDDIEDTLAHFTSYEIKHLHELQNALTLCKIEKEIEL